MVNYRLSSCRNRAHRSWGPVTYLPPVVASRMTVGSSWCNPARSSWPPWEVTRVCGRSFVSCILKISLSSESCSLKMSTGHELSRRERRPWGSTPAPEKDAVDFLDGRRGRGSELRDTRGETPPFHSRKSRSVNARRGLFSLSVALGGVYVPQTSLRDCTVPATCWGVWPPILLGDRT